METDDDFSQRSNRKNSVLIISNKRYIKELISSFFHFLFIKLCCIFCELFTKWAYRFFRKACKGEIYGLNVIQTNIKSGFILVANHASYLDWLVLLGLFKQKFNIALRFLAKDKVFKHPFLFAVPYGSHAIRVLDNGTRLPSDAYKQILETKHIGIFPEGTRSADGKLLEPNIGAIWFALKKQTPIIPCSLVGFYDVWPRHRILPKQKKCKIIFSKEIFYPRTSFKLKNDKENLKAEMYRIMESIYKHVLEK